MLLVLAALSACGDQNKQVLRVGTNVWPGYEPLYLARSLGHYDASKVHLVELPSASQVIQGIRSRTLEGGALTLDEALGLLADDLDLTIILVMDYSNGGDLLLAKPDVTSLTNLAGKTVAAEVGGVGAILLNAALNKVNLTVDDISILPCPVDQHVDCYAHADAVVTFDPAATQLLKQGAIKLFDSSEVPGQIVDVLVVRRDIAETQSHALRTLLRGYFLARRYMAENPGDAAVRMAPRLGVSPDEVLLSFNGIELPDLQSNLALMSGSPSQLETTAAGLTRFLVKHQLLHKGIPTQGIVSADFLPKAKDL